MESSPGSRNKDEYPTPLPKAHRLGHIHVAVSTEDRNCGQPEKRRS